MHISKRLALMLTTFMIGGLTGGLAVQSSAFAETVSSPGPLAVVAVTPDLNCTVHHVGDTRGAFYNDTACGTLVAVDGTLFGPAAIPGGSSAGPRTPFTPVTQSAVTGTGSTDDPFTIVTEVDLGTTGVRLTQTDAYRVGEEIFRTGVSLTKSGTDAVNAIVYRAGDCYLQGSDIGYGMVGSPAGAIGCTAEPAPNPGGRAVQWRPLTEGSHYLQDRYDRLWAAIGAQHPFADTCACTEPLDNGAGLSWSVTVGNSPTVVSSQISVTGNSVPEVPQANLSVNMTDSADPVAPGANLSYTATVTNAGPSPAEGVNLGIETPASTSFVSLASPAGWTCTTPLPGGRSPVTCTNAGLAVSSQVFTFVVKVDAAPAGGFISSRADVFATTADPNLANNSDTETSAVAAPPAPAADSLMAVGTTTNLPKAGGGTLQAKANDVVRYSPATNTYSLVFRGDGFGLSGATIDALSVDPATRDLILSFTQSRTVTGIGTVQAEDLVAFHPTSSGVMTQGTFRLFFDGSDINLSGTAENIDAVDVAPNGTIYFSTQGAFDIRSGAARLTGNDKSIVACTAPTLGNTSACSGLSTHRSGTSVQLTGTTENVDAFDLTADGKDILSTTGAYAVTGDTGHGTDAFACKSGTCSRSFTGAAHALLRLADIETGTLPS